MASINHIPTIRPSQFESLLSKFPEMYRDKLRLYTGEELFYVYKLLTFDSSPDSKGDWKSKDLFYLGLKAKVIKWLKGEKDEYGRLYQPLYPSAWAKLTRFKSLYIEYVGTYEAPTRDSLDALREKMNAKVAA
jgi:hypothetical protein